MDKPLLGIGLIGSGFMGRAHALAWRNVGALFPLPYQISLQALADVDATQASAAAEALGFAAATGDWHALIADPDVHVVSITTPNVLHKEMALAAIAAGKHVACEKPLAPGLTDAQEMADAARRAGVRTSVGFNYLKNPMLRLARDIVRDGGIGEIRSFRGIHAEGFMADAEVPWSWRLDPASGGGALVDIGSHIISMAHYLLGPIAEVRGQTATVIGQRPSANGMRRVEVDDVAHARIVFSSGVIGTIEANWIATGRTMQLEFEIYGSEGALVFSQERFNELRLFDRGDRAGRQGFRTIHAGPDHPPYGAFCVAPGHQIGFNDLKTIEMHDFARSIGGEETGLADFDEGVSVLRVVDAIYRSARGDGRSVAIAGGPVRQGR